jgi:hypothetical protein
VGGSICTIRSRLSVCWSSKGTWPTFFVLLHIQQALLSCVVLNQAYYRNDASKRLSLVFLLYFAQTVVKLLQTLVPSPGWMMSPRGSDVLIFDCRSWDFEALLNFQTTFNDQLYLCNRRSQGDRIISIIV